MKMFDTRKTRMIGLPYSEKNVTICLAVFHLIPERNRRIDRRMDGKTDGQTDGWTDLLYQSVC